MTGKEQGDPDATLTIAVGLVGTILLFVVVVGLVALFHRAEDAETTRKVIGRAPEELKGILAEQQTLLNGYRWVDTKKGIVSIPVDRAMELVRGEIPSRASRPAPAPVPR